MKKIRYFFEAAALYGAFALFRLLGVDRASAFGGWAGRTLGPKMGASRKALTNIRRAFPEKSEAEHRDILRDMWDNLGRVMAEYPHLKEICEKRIELVNDDILDAYGLDKPFLILGAHLANWEASFLAGPIIKGVSLDGVIREPNNPFVQKLLAKCRNPLGQTVTFPKSRAGAMQMVKALKNGRRVGILIDQKYNEGLPIPFFGRPAMTSPALAQLSRKFDCPIFPSRIERLKGANFRITIHPAIMAGERSDEDIMTQANRVLEDWIHAAPGQWLWLHRRWDLKALQNA